MRWSRSSLNCWASLLTVSGVSITQAWSGGRVDVDEKLDGGGVGIVDIDDSDSAVDCVSVVEEEDETNVASSSVSACDGGRVLGKISQRRVKKAKSFAV